MQDLYMALATIASRRGAIAAQLNAIEAEEALLTLVEDVIQERIAREEMARNTTHIRPGDVFTMDPKMFDELFGKRTGAEPCYCPKGYTAQEDAKPNDADGTAQADAQWNRPGKMERKTPFADGETAPFVQTNGETALFRGIVAKFNPNEWTYNFVTNRWTHDGPYVVEPLTTQEFTDRCRAIDKALHTR